MRDNYSIDENRQRWLMVFRLVSNTFIVVALFLLNGQSETAPVNLLGTKLEHIWFPLGLLILSVNYFLAAFYCLVLPQFLGSKTQIAIQLMGDLLFTLAIVFISGGGDSTFSFLFIIIIINSAFLAGLRAALIAASLVILAWAGLLNLHYYNYFVGWLADIRVTTQTSQLIIAILSNSTACFLVALLGGHLSNQLSISKLALLKSQRSLARLAELNDNIIQSIDIGLVTIDAEGLVLSINKFGMNLLGLYEDEIIGLPWGTILPELKKVINDDQFYKAHKLKFNYLRHKDNNNLVIELETTELLDKTNEVWGRLLVLTDLTVLRRMEAEVKKAEHLASLGELAAGMAHEIRTPLASMTGAWHMLASESTSIMLEKSDKLRLTDIIGREMDRLAQLVSDFLAFARPSSSAPEIVDLAQLVADQLRVFQHRQTIGFKINVETFFEEVPKIFFDAGQLTQILWNLLQNSVEAVKPGEDLNIKVYIKLSTNNFVKLSIIDNGVGMENTNKIFEPFFTTKKNGTGLGLAILGRMMHDGGARIFVESQVGVGSTFNIYLPLA